MLQTKRALFLDRDGVINEDLGYVSSIDKLIFKPDIFTVSKFFFDKGYLVIIVTNQSGIARGYYTLKNFEKITEYISEQFKAFGVNITETFFCPHLPGAKLKEYDKICDCRKPKAGMILSAADKYNLNLHNSILIGDNISDTIAGNSAGIKNNFLLVDKKNSNKKTNYYKEVSRLSDILNKDLKID